VNEFKAGAIHLNLEPPLRVVRCSHCALLFMSPRPSASAQEKIFAGEMPEGLESYLTNLASYGSVTRTRLPLFRKRIEDIQQKFSLPKNATVLDIGASSGEFLVAATERGLQAMGVEPSADGVKSGLAKGLNMVQSPAEQLPFADETFDLVHSNHVFEHLANPQQSANEAFRVLKKGGVIFIEVPNQFDNIQFFRDRIMGRINVRERNVRSIHHFYFFSQKTLQHLLERAGFNQVKVYDRYGRSRTGLARLASMVMHFLGKFYLGGPLIQGVGKKS
jgi:ubiquinone/menaquinone biosynthesis C-methylase UbiE